MRKPGVVLKPRWYTVAETAQLLGFGLSKTKMLVATRKIRSVKDGGHRRILPEWIDDYIARQVAESEDRAA
ncbi:excisionase family DNA-binding protein [Actinopolymorpha sp. B17G11]|uniref:excisionase family DNA-binding protein n=1 Tax=Actinopolymorpha sp. B17G11 TaxID=3160861 RepID=UPI0032E4DFEC